jgi:O-antigen ligase
VTSLDAGDDDGSGGDRPDGPARASLAWLPAAALLLAVAGAVDAAGFRPFTTARWAAVGVAAAAAAAVTRWRVPRGVGLVWLGLLGWTALATAMALDPLLAALGHPRRHLGLAGGVVFALAFAGGTGLPAATVRRRLGPAAVVAAGITGAAALADLAGWDPAGVRFAGGRVGGLLGQPAYLAAAILVLAPVAAGVALDLAASRGWRIAAGAAAASCAAALVATGTRGAWAGAAVAALVAVVARRRHLRLGLRGPVRLPRPVAQHAHAAGPILLAGAVAVVALGVVVAPRLAATLDPGSPGGRGRIDEWRVAAAVVAERPIVGVGPEGYRIAAPAHIDDAYTRRHGRDVVVDRAHDGVLDVAAAAGLPAAILYVGLLAAVVVAAVRVVRRPPDPVVAGAALALVAWVTQQLVSFPIAEVDPAAWLLAGVVVVGARPVPAGIPGVPPAGRLAAAGRVAAGLVAVVLAVAGATAVLADRDLGHAGRLRSGSVAAVLAADRATALRPDDVDAWYVAAQLAAARPGLLAVDSGLDRVEAGLRRSPRDPALRALDEQLLAERALRSGLPADLAAAEQASRALVADDPAGPAHHRTLGLVLAARGGARAEAWAKSELRRALDLDPHDAAARDALDRLTAGTGR